MQFIRRKRKDNYGPKLNEKRPFWPIIEALKEWPKREKRVVPLYMEPRS
jgi:hypothetical protein